MFIDDYLTQDIQYIFSPLSLLNSEWRWDDAKFDLLPKDKLILANCASENWGTGSFIDSLYVKLKEYNLNFLILSHDPTDHLKKSQVVFYQYWYQHSIKSFDKTLLDPILENTVRNYKLSCLNGCPRPHRVLNYFKLLEKNYAGMFMSMHSIPEGITARDDDYRLDSATAKKWADVSAQFNDRITSSCSQVPDNKAYLDTYVNLVTETTVTPKLFITEKTWKPVASGQLFLIVGGPGIVAFLREQGVDTFDDYVDHSYDSETDFVTRLDKLYTSLDKLMLSNLEDIYTQTKSRRLKNSTQFFSGAFDTHYAKALIKCINTQN